MNSGIRAYFNQRFANLPINREFVKQLQKMQTGFVNRNEAHMSFFGGTLTGVEKVVFMDADRDRLFIDILGVDEAEIVGPIHNLPDINPEFAVSSDVFNITCAWIIHALHVSRYLSAEEKKAGQMAIALYLNYKLLTSLLNRYFRYPANPETAAATYAALSYRFILKREGSWAGALNYRASELLADHSIWKHEIEKLDSDRRVVEMLNDIQNRVREMLKAIYDVFVDVHNHGTKIRSSSAMVEIDGEVIVRERTSGLEVYVRYIKDTIIHRNAFIKQELLDIVTDVVPTAPPHRLEELLQWVSDNFVHHRTGELEQSIDAIMEHAFAYMQANRQQLANHFDLTDVMVRMRGTYTSSRASDPKLMEIKDQVEKIVRQGTKVKNEAAVAALRTAYCLYVIIRAFTMHHYTNAGPSSN